MKTLLIIDGPNLMYRFGHARAKYLRSEEPVFDSECIKDFTHNIHYLRRKFSKANIQNTVIVWDGGLSERRKALVKKAQQEYGWDIPDYKANRHSDWRRSMHQARLEMESGVLREALGIKSIMLVNREADDIIAELCDMISEESYHASSGPTIMNIHYDKSIIVSTDKDFYQLLDNHVMIWRHMPPHEKLVKYRSFLDQHGICGEELVLVNALASDPSDSIVGAYGVGKKTALSYVKQSEEYTLQGLIKYLFCGSSFTIEKDGVSSKPCPMPKGKRADSARDFVMPRLDSISPMELNIQLLELGLEEFNPEEMDQIREVFLP